MEAEFLEAGAEVLQFGCGDGGSVGEAVGDDGVEVLEVAAVDGGGFAGDDGGVDGGGFGPEGCVGGGELCSVLGEVLLPGFEGGEDVGFAVVEEVVGYVADADGGLCGSGGDVEDGVGEGGGVAKVAEDEADGVEGLARGGSRRPKRLFAAGDGVGGAVAGEAAESGGDADGAAGVGADGCEG